MKKPLNKFRFTAGVPGIAKIQHAKQNYRPEQVLRQQLGNPGPDKMLMLNGFVLILSSQTKTGNCQKQRYTKPRQLIDKNKKQAVVAGSVNSVRINRQ